MQRIPLDEVKKLEEIQPSIEAEIKEIIKLIEELDMKRLEKKIREVYDLNRTRAKEVVQATLVSFTDDATKVMKEKETLVVKHGDNFYIDLNTNRFITQIWRGDLYDAEGLEGVKLFLEDLQRQKEILKSGRELVKYAKKFV